MKNIVAAHFEDFAHAEAALVDLDANGIATQDVDHLVLGAPGRHDRFPIGGDEDADAGAANGEKGAASGAALGGAAGAASGALLGPLGALAGAAVGAYTGSLAGALQGMGDAPGRPSPPPRPAGVMLMVHVNTPDAREIALEAFRRHDARAIEQAEGQWIGGSWDDFNPVATPDWLQSPLHAISA
ncbi:MAG: hypothetical protein ABI537_03145 [Casimicrobiaceae bacterium]